MIRVTRPIAKLMTASSSRKGELIKRKIIIVQERLACVRRYNRIYATQIRGNFRQANKRPDLINYKRKTIAERKSLKSESGVRN